MINFPFLELVCDRSLVFRDKDVRTVYWSIN